jgi:hypothetical protein
MVLARPQVDESNQAAALMMGKGMVENQLQHNNSLNTDCCCCCREAPPILDSAVSPDEATSFLFDRTSALPLPFSSLSIIQLVSTEL